ncbi:MAG: YibE/F family protein [Spirochaetes bacterium]|jgi:uncharacterized membrane protein|nr:YibE/F family protein [Spirochaetota bacterium]
MKMVLRLLVPVFILFPLASGAGTYQKDVDYFHAKIEKIEKARKTAQGQPYLETVFSLRLLSGPEKDGVKTVIFKGDENVPDYVKYRQGDTIFIGQNTIFSDDGTDEYITMHDIDNTFGLVTLAAIFLVALFLVGRGRGILSLFGLSFTVLLIFFVFIPLTLKGHPPLLSVLLVSIAAIGVTIPLITGLGKKTLTAIAGASAGVLVSMAFSIAFGWTMHLSGIITDELLTLFYTTSTNINLRDIALAGMILSALGAVMDVSISISSAVNEFYVVHPGVDSRTAFRSAIEVGRDNLGSMVNTLIMAYVGGALSLILIIYLRFDSRMPVSMIFSHNEILVEVLRSFVGCMGMLVSVPVTAAVGVWLNRSRRQAS